MNHKVSELFKKLEKNPILLYQLSKKKDVVSLYKKAIRIIGGYTVDDLRFALEELKIIPRQNNQSRLNYVSGGSSAVDENTFSKLISENYNGNAISN